MSTYSWSSVLAQGTDAEFRAWGSELHAALAAVGLVQTADTGQIDWATVTRAAGGSIAGYSVWRTADSSLYYRVAFGSDYAGQSVPRLDIIVGQGSDGSGTLTGVEVGVSGNDPSFTSLASTTTPYMSYLSASNDHFTLVWKYGANVYNGGCPRKWISFGKTVNSSGAMSTLGVTSVFNNLNLNGTSCCVGGARFASPASGRSYSTNHVVAVPGTPASTLVGANVQAYLIWQEMPEVIPLWHAAVFRRSELTAFTTVSTALVGGVDHTYLVLAAADGLVYGLPGTDYSVLLCYE